MKRRPNLAVLATSHNRVIDLDVWVKALGKARARVEREFKSFQRPWFAQFDRQGKFTKIYTITEEHSSRRNRLREK